MALDITSYLMRNAIYAVDRNVAREGRSRWRRISLKQMFFATTVIATCLSWISHSLDVVSSREQAVERLLRIGAFLSPTSSDPAVWRCWFLGESRHSVVDCVRLEYRDASEFSDFVDDLAKLPNLSRLELYSTKLRDAQVVEICDKLNLKELNISKTGISDDALRRIGKQQNLEVFQCIGTSVSDAGLSQLSLNAKLRRISIAYSLVTPAGVGKLRQENERLVSDVD